MTKTGDIRQMMTPKKAGLPSIGDGRAFGFFYVAPATHHLYYLVPYIRATKHRSVLVFDPSDEYLARLHQSFPDINFLPCRGDDLPEARRLFCQYSVLMFANGYSGFIHGVQPYLPLDILLVRVCHGSSHKFANDAGFYTSSVYAWDAVVVLGRKELDLFYDLSKMPREKRRYDNVIRMKRGEQGHFFLLQSGNLRISSFEKSAPARKKARGAWPFLDPNKKTILVMPTLPENPTGTIDSYSGLGLFLALLDAMEGAEDYNFVFKLHPNLATAPALMDSLKMVCGRKGVPLNYDLFTADYLPIMSLADAMITDRSSAVFDFLHFNKPVIFLDNTGECPEELAWNDVRQTFWSYRNGPVIAPATQGRFEETLASVFQNDAFEAIRAKSLEYAFAKGVTAQSVMSSLLTHPKLASSKGVHKRQKAATSTDLAIRQETEGLVLGAGLGERIGEGPKAFFRLRGKSLLRMAIEAQYPHVRRVIAAVPPAHVADAVKDVGHLAAIIEGGETRQESVERLLDYSSAPLLVLSEVCRPLATSDLVRAVRDAAHAEGAAVPFTTPHHPIALADDGWTNQAYNKEQLLLPQTPQAYRRALLLRAIKFAKANNLQMPSTFQLLQAAGIPVRVVPGEEHNIKITTPLDWEIARRVISVKRRQRVKKNVG